MIKLKQDFGVRALLAVMIVGTTLGNLTFWSVYGSWPAVATLISMSGAVTGWYYHQRRHAASKGEEGGSH